MENDKKLQNTKWPVCFKNYIYRHKNVKPKLKNIPTPLISVECHLKFVFYPSI